MELNFESEESVREELEKILAACSNPTDIHILAEMESLGVSNYMTQLILNVRKDKNTPQDVKVSMVGNAEHLIRLAISIFLFQLFLRDREFLEYAVTEEALQRHQSEVRAAWDGSTDEEKGR